MELNKEHYRHCLLMLFNWKKTAAEAHRILIEIYGEETAPSDYTCNKWYRRFRSGDFDVKDKERPGQPKKFKNEDLQALLDEDSTRTETQLATALNVTQPAINKRLQAMGKKKTVNK